MSFEYFCQTSSKSILVNYFELGLYRFKAGRVFLRQRAEEHVLCGCFFLNTAHMRKKVKRKNDKHELPGPSLGLQTPLSIQGGPAKVKPTYIFAGNVWYLNIEKKSMFFGKCDNSLARHTFWEA